MRFNVRDNSVRHGEVAHAEQIGEWSKILHRLYVTQSSSDVRLAMLARVICILAGFGFLPFLIVVIRIVVPMA